MAPSQDSRPRHALADTTLDDLYDYAGSLPRRSRRRAKRDRMTWSVTDDWPKEVPVTEGEIDVFEAYFGDLFDDLFGKS